MIGQPSIRTVLVLEDDPTIHFLLKEILSADYSVVASDSSNEVLHMATTERIDAFLLDVDVKGSISGVECCRRLRTLPDYQYTPIVVMSGLDERDVVVSAFEAGADDFLQKPFFPEAVVLRLRLHLQRVDYFRELQKIRSELGRFVSTRTRHVAEEAAAGRHIVPSSRELAVLFTDIREFTALSGKVAPQALFDSLSVHLNQQIELVYEHHGYVDKFSGDGLLAVFDGDGCVSDACLCALRIRDYSAGARFEYLPEIARTGIGLHWGPVIAGTLGTTRHRDYSVIGLTVNVAARLCGHAEAMSIVASDAVRRVAASEARVCFKHERQVPIRGLEESMTVYSLEWA